MCRAAKCHCHRCQTWGVGHRQVRHPSHAVSDVCKALRKTGRAKQPATDLCTSGKVGFGGTSFRARLLQNLGPRRVSRHCDDPRDILDALRARQPGDSAAAGPCTSGEPMPSQSWERNFRCRRPLGPRTGALESSFRRDYNAPSLAARGGRRTNLRPKTCAPLPHRNFAKCRRLWANRGFRGPAG